MHLILSHGPNCDVSKIIICTECGYQTLDPNSMKRHNRSNHLQEKKYYCDICGIKSFYRKQVRNHIKILHNKTNGRVKSIDCTQCQTNVEHDRCHANQHNKSSKKEPKKKQYFCNSCNYMTSTKKYFKMHLKLSHGPNFDVSKIITCTECGYQTLDPNSMKRHNRSKHLGETKYFCDICGLKSFYRFNIRKSYQNQTQENQCKS